MEEKDSKEKKIIDDNRELAQGVTIDGETSQDLDDAIFLERDGDGWVAHVSISDVSAQVKIGSGLDQKAKIKAFTRYFADSSKPMLPKVLSHNYASLLEGQERLTITVSIPLSKELNVGTPVIRLTKLKSQKKLSYTKVDKIIADKDHELHTLLNDCGQIAQLLLNKRRKKGALAVYDIMNGWATTEEGQLIKLAKDKAHLANIIVQEFMILTNIVVADFLADKNVPVLFRNHTAKPIAPERSNLLQNLMHAIVDPVTFNVDTLQQRLNVILNKADYGPQLHGHYALNLPAYMHFTSPIRRYADLINHRILVAVLKEKKIPYSFRDLEEIAQHINQVDLDLRKKKKEFYVKKKENEAKKLLFKDDEYNALEPEDLHKVVKLICENGNLTDSMSVELKKRLSNNELPLKDIFYLLCLVPAELRARTIWTNLYEKIIVWMKKNPSKAMELFYIIKAKKRLGNIKYQASNLESGEFQTIAEIKMNGKQYESTPCHAKTKKESEQLAVIDVLSAIFGSKDKFFDSPVKVALQDVKHSKCPATIDELGAKEFHHAVKSACARGVMTDELKKALLKRLLAVELPIQDIFYVLYKVKNFNEKWDDIRSKIMHWLIMYPDKAASIMAMGNQELHWSVVDYKITSEGPDHMLLFRTKGIVHIGQMEIISKEYVFPLKKKAKQIVILDLLAKIAGVKIEIDNYINTLPAQKGAPQMTDTTNYKGRLLELCQKNTWEAPDFHIIPKGADHCRTFECRAEITVNAILYSSDVIEGANKKGAEQLACKDLLEKIPPSAHKKKIQPLNVQQIDSTAQDENFVAILQEFCQKNNFELPYYPPVNKKGPDHMPIIEIVCVLKIDEDHTISHTAKASNKKAAKQMAAKNVYRKLMKHLNLTV